MDDLAVTFVDLAISGVAILAVAVWNRTQFLVRGSSFPCRLAYLRARNRPVRIRYPPLKTRARWIGSDLMVQVGPLWSRTLRISPGTSLNANVRSFPRSRGLRLGSRPKSLRLTCASSGPVEIAVRQQNQTRLVGPYLAAVACLPTAASPVRRWRSR
jgi:hypothetical protein